MDANESMYTVCILGIQFITSAWGLAVEINTAMVIPCEVKNATDYPSWSGPPFTLNGLKTTYSNQPDPKFNPSLGEDRLHRLRWADNKRDLNLSAVKRADEGEYSCTAVPWGSVNVTVTVRVPPALPNIYNTATVSQNELTVSGTEGTPLTLTCISGGGYPQQTVNWYRESVSSMPLPAGPPVVVSGELYNVTRNYIFTPTSSDDGVKYICQSSYSGEPQLIRTTEVKLILKLQPSTPTVTFLGILTESPSSVNIARCSSSGFRPQTVSLWWTIGGGTKDPVSSPVVKENTADNTFSVFDTYYRAVGRAENGKTLTCYISHESLPSPKNASETLNVQFPALFTNISGIPSIVANGVNKMSLTCTTGSSNPASNITWYQDGQDVSSEELAKESAGQYGGRMTSQMLVLTPTRDMDGHVIKCSAGNGLSGSFAEDQVTLDLTYIPVVNTISRMENETKPGLLQCLVTSKPAAHIKWYRVDNRETFLIEGTDINSLEYQIITVSRDDAGSYKCIANNGIEEDISSTVDLVVQYKPDVTIIAHNTTENNQSELKCQPRGVPNSYTYTSWKQTWPGSSDVLRSFPGSANLTLSDLRYEHTGIYTCSVDNGVEYSKNPSAGQGQVLFVVKSRPFVATTHQTIQKAVQLGNVTTIAIEFVSNAPGTKINVEKRGNDTAAQTILFTTTTLSAITSIEVFNKTVQTDGFLSEINITVVNQDDFGLYDIVIENDVGIEKRTVILVPKGPPIQPKIMSITNIMETSALLTWTRGFHGGYDQTVTIETSRDGISWMLTRSLPQGMLDDTSPVNTTITELHPASLYYLRMFSVNAEGSSSRTGLFNFTTKDTGGPEGSPTPLIIGGAVGGTAAAAVIIVIAVLLVRKFNWKCPGLKEDNSRLTREHRLHSIQEKHDDSDEDEVINPIYDSQGNNETKNTSADTIYAQPNKAKKTSLLNHPSDIYAEVNKGKKGKKKTNKNAKKEEQDVYENSQPSNSGKNQDYSNNGFDKSEEHSPKNHVNKDGLLYADIVFANPPKGQKRLVIDGHDDMTEYATVDLTKKADPLPDRDEEKCKQ